MPNMNVSNLHPAARVVFFFNQKSPKPEEREKRILFLAEQSRNVYENKGHYDKMSVKMRTFWHE